VIAQARRFATPSSPATLPELIATVRNAHIGFISAASDAIQKALAAGEALNAIEDYKLVDHGDWAGVYSAVDDAIEWLESNASNGGEVYQIINAHELRLIGILGRIAPGIGRIEAEQIFRNALVELESAMLKTVRGRVHIDTASDIIRNVFDEGK
jgi:hypothetical protein